MLDDDATSFAERALLVVAFALYDFIRAYSTGLTVVAISTELASRFDALAAIAWRLTK